MCKMAHFGNCDPETADQEYCIFHKPNKTEEEAVEFYRKFLERFKPRQREIKRSVPQGQKVVTCTIFDIPVDCRGFVFPKIPKDMKSLFSHAIFRRGAIFDWTIFEEHVDFTGAEFYDSPKGKRFFGGARFYKAIFKGNADFAGAIFHCNVKFEEVVFEGEAWFEGSHFEQVTEFTKSKFEDIANFEYAVFEKEVSFWKVSFGKEAWFVATIFRGDVDFEETTFNEVPIFADWEDFADENWRSQYKFKFYGKLNFSNSDIRKGIKLDLPSEWFKLPEAEIEARRVQRLSYEKEGKRDEADRMFVLEMRAKRRARLRNAQGKLEKLKARTHNFIEWLLGDLPSEYGTNWVRLFLLSLLVIIGNAVPYTLWSAYIDGFPQTSNYLVRFADALYYSLVTFTTLGYGDMHPTGWLKALSAIEALTGAIFMALIVAVIARKWMR
ncbi:hypothetical protein E3E35_05580 [Thermococcus sp. GR7]|uniref:potassium channel family protein n=1 Tax=unclassified Thermococcus TaxID=2627626 RepID=UPI001430E6F6|nr:MULTISPECIES: potassium channel family protein [unclassified Thermococcus]NJE46889.1 hypothetical protein [Thermococcus sp. GR7]NJE78386.1 hypothetical protein [Thermococcus sp. GR4]NJF23317.1 hypothetical protein [Thermococcus sp. GR5]